MDEINHELNKISFEFESSSGTKYYYFTESGAVLQKDLFHSDPERQFKYLSREKKFNEMFVFNKTEVEVRSLKQVLLQGGLQELLIEVTSACNFRCRYCVFSGEYKSNREHGLKYMSFETAKKAIDIYFSYFNQGEAYNSNRKPTIAFYGGEPLLNFDVIKKSIDYIKSIYHKEILIIITTNAYLLTDEMIDYFVKNNIELIFSIDGPQEEHDRNRKTYDGKATFSIAIKNAEHFAKLIKRPVFVNSVYDLKTDLKKTMQFFSNNEYLQNLQLSMVNPFNTNFYNKFSLLDNENYERNLREIEKEFFENLDKNESYNRYELTINSFVARPLLNILMRKMHGSNLNSLIKFTGMCVPGFKLFVDVNGDFKPCEKVGDGMVIGNIKEGLSFSKIKDYLDDYAEFVNQKCIRCKYKTLCYYCFMTFWDGKDFNFSNDLCIFMGKSIKKLLPMYYDILEKNPKWFSFFTEGLYKDLGELEVTLR